MDVTHRAKAIRDDSHTRARGLPVCAKVRDFQIPHIPELDIAQKQRVRDHACAVNAWFRPFAIHPEQNRPRLAIYELAGPLRLELACVLRAGFEEELVAGLED